MAKRRGNNEGSIIKRKDGRWMAAATIGYNPVTGRAIRKYHYGKKREEVNCWLIEILTAIKKPIIERKRGKMFPLIEMPCKEGASLSESDVEGFLCNQYSLKRVLVNSQVRDRNGIIDILTNKEIVEVKTILSRRSIMEAIGQLLVYSRICPNKDLVIAGIYVDQHSDAVNTAIDCALSEGINVQPIKVITSF